MVDCGTTSCWENALRPYLIKLKSSGKKIDFAVLSHIDSDHIGGALHLFADPEMRSLIGEVWYNSLRHLASQNIKASLTKNEQAILSSMATIGCEMRDVTSGEISANQAMQLTELLDEAKVTWNRCSNNNAICSNTRSLRLAPNIQIDFLLPSKVAMKSLLQEFQYELNKRHMGMPVVATSESEHVFEAMFYNQRDTQISSNPIAGETPSLNDIEKWAIEAAKPDLSVTNASSIAFIVLYGDHALLFPGDATAEELLPALSCWKTITNHSLFFDVIKLPHHGSMNNCLPLFDLIDGKYFLISTDGRKYAHPSKETLAKIVSRSCDFQRHLIFNYPNEMYYLFSDLQMEQKYRYSTEVQTESTIL